MENGSINGIYQEWDENGTTILLGEAKLGIKLRYKEMDAQGNLNMREAFN